MKSFSITMVLCMIFCFNSAQVYSQVWDASDYSEYKTAHQYLPAYPDQQSFANFPEFSWDKVARWTILRSSQPFDSVDIRGIAKNFQVIVHEKANSQGLNNVEAGTIRSAERLKEVNPKMKSFFYWNTVVNYGGYAANAEFEPNAWDWCQMTPGVHGQDTFKLIRDRLRMFNAEVPELRNWWVKTAVNVVSDPAIDGVFIDKVHSHNGPFFDENGNPANNYIRMLDSLGKSLPDTSLYIGNTIRNERWNGNREQMIYQDGSYLERQEFVYRGYDQTDVEARVVNLQLMREMATKGKIVLWRLSPGHFGIMEPPEVQTEENMIRYFKNAVEFPLAMHLISAEKYTYFGYLGTVDGTHDKYLYLTDYIPELNRPLGEPLGPPTKDGYVFTRSFKYVDVWLNMETLECSLTWKDPVPDPALSVTGFSTYPNSLTVKTKSSGQLGSSFSPLEAGNTKVIWTSSDTSIATVDSNGVVSGIEAGIATITGTSVDGGFTDYTWVTVVKDLVGMIPPGVNYAPYGIASQSSIDYDGEPSRAIDENISGAYSQSSVTHTANEPNPWWQVDLGDDFTIGHIKIYGRTDECCKARLSDYTVYVLDANGDTTYSQSINSFPDPYEIIEVGDTTGKIVLVKLNNTSALSLAEVQVFIKPVEVTGIEIEETQISIQLEEIYQLNAKISPSNATIKELTWTSNKNSVATVDSDGKVKGVGIGSATISATSYNGTFTATSSVSVTEIPVDSIRISLQNADLFPGDTLELSAIISPGNASDPAIRWKSSDPDIASVNSAGIIIANDVGTATISAISSNPEISDECQVTVKSIQVTGVIVSPETVTLITGDTIQLNAVISPSNATDRHINWESDDITIATVSDDGLVTGLSEGTATVTATTRDGGFTDKSIITISDPSGINDLKYLDFAWEGATVEIYNSTGSLVRKQVFSGNPVFEIDDLPQGIYILIGHNKGSVIRVKIFI